MKIIHRNTTKTYAVRVTGPLERLIEGFMKYETFLNPSELIRAALREKIKEEAPSLYYSVYQEN